MAAVNPGPVGTAVGTVGTARNFRLHFAAGDGIIPFTGCRIAPEYEYALVAQLDRVLDSDSKGRWFESSREHDKPGAETQRFSAGLVFLRYRKVF